MCGFCSQGPTDQMCGFCATCNVEMCDKCGHFHESDDEEDEEFHAWYCPEHFDGKIDVQGCDFRARNS